MSNTQVAVIGAGPGGYAAAFHAADLGLDVTLIDPADNPGGVCLYRGCIPSKALLHAAEVIEQAAAAESMGIHFSAPEIDRIALAQWKQSVVDKLVGGLGQLAKRREIRYVQGTARFASETSLEIDLTSGDRETVNFEHAILATGSIPSRPGPLAAEHNRIWDSTRALDLPEIPGRLLVVGGGYIGLELATVYAALGSEVTVVEMTDGLLPGADRDLVRVLAKKLKTSLNAIHTEATVTELDPGDAAVTATVEIAGEAQRLEAEAVLVATGRRPHTDGLALEAADLTVSEDGFLDVDAQRRTRNKRIFAIGDVAGQPMLAHKASAEGRIAAQAIAGKPGAAWDVRAIPAVVFTHPEVAWCGLTETEAADTDVQIEVARFPWGASGRARTLGDADGLTKLVTDAASGRILGGGIVGPGAGELINELCLAVEFGAVAEDLAATIHAHPTLAETLMEAAEAVEGTATHIYKPR